MSLTHKLAIAGIIILVFMSIIYIILDVMIAYHRTHHKDKEKGKV